ncbi:MAG TPA: pilus assembly PilX N-terminal domain-containing protein [Polyangiaceae bacterium]|jgi:hypothetical protein|nr:pilus assembly PilX N-terminal domain-containing protein [Polyangiaceae bacterium]
MNTHAHVSAHRDAARARGLARLRAARRRDQDGAAMFVVAMTVAVLASVGIFALAAASTEVRMSGNERQSTQTHYLAEYGVLAAAHELNTKSIDSEFGMMRKYRDTCLALANVPAIAPPTSRYCRRRGSVDLSQNWDGTTRFVTYGGTAPFTPGVPPGSFGATPTNGDFFVEETDQGDAEPKGASGKHCTKMLTLTSYGFTQPLFPNLANAVTSTYGSEGLEIQRAHIQVLGMCGGS